MLPIWPEGFTADASDGTIRVLDGNGRIVASLGKRVRIGGGEVGGSLDEIAGVDWALARQLRQRCPRSYWLVGEFPVDPSR